MEKIVYLKSINEVDKYNSFDSYLIESIFSSCYQNVFYLEDIKKIAEYIHSLNKKIYLRADKILVENELSFIDDNKDVFSFVDGIFFEDFSFVSYFKNHEINCELIYFPYDGLGDIEDINAILSLGISRICLPSLKESLILKTHEKVGYRPIYREILFNTRRKLLSLYKDINGVHIDNNKYLLMEKTRTSLQEIIETPYGTIILNEVKKIGLIGKPSFVLFDSLFVDENDFMNYLKEVFLDE